MTCIKKLTALLVSAALALSLLAGCGGSKALSQVIADLLSGQYNNVTVEVDPDLTAALKKAAAAGSTQEEVLAALVENLNLSGGSITFNNLGDGQQGQHGVTLTFQPGSDPDAAARSAFTEWNRVFSSLPDDGSYRAHVSMIEAENGYYIAVDVEVLRAGSHDKDEPDDNDEDEDDEPAPSKDPYTKVDDQNYTINTSEGLQKLVEDLNWPKANTILSVNITLDEDVALDGTWIPIGNSQSNAYTGTFDGQGHKISGLRTSDTQYAGLFGYIQGGTVKSLDVEVENVTSDYHAGGIAAFIIGSQIEDCTVSGGEIKAERSDNQGTAGGIVGYIQSEPSKGNSRIVNCTVSQTRVVGDTAGGIAGSHNGTNNCIEGCTVSNSNITTNSSSGSAGGIAGSQSWSTIKNCFVNNNTITATIEWSRVGGVVGNIMNATMIACGSAGNTIQSAITQEDGQPAAGGVAGYVKTGNITACFSAEDTISGPLERIGGIVGYTSKSTIKECYWSGTITNGCGSSSTGPNDTHKVGDLDDQDQEITWSTVVSIMNRNGDAWTNNGPYPTLK